MARAAAVPVEILETTRPMLLRAQVDHLYQNARFGMVATLVNGAILVGILRSAVDRHALILWGALLATLTLARYVHGEYFRRHVSGRRHDDVRWLLYFGAGIGASGLLWGLAGIVLRPESLPHQTFLAFIVGGMVAGAAATFSIRMDVFLVFTVPALAPLVFRFLRAGDELHVAMGTMVFLFGLLLTGVAYRVSDLFNRQLRMRSRLRQMEAVWAHREQEGAGSVRETVLESALPSAAEGRELLSEARQESPGTLGELHGSALSCFRRAGLDEEEAARAADLVEGVGWVLVGGHRLSR